MISNAENSLGKQIIRERWMAWRPNQHQIAANKQIWNAQIEEPLNEECREMEKDHQKNNFYVKTRAKTPINVNFVL